MLGRPVIAKRANDDPSKFLEELTAMYNFTPAEAEQVSTERQAWAAVPVFGPDGPIAVVFLDSSERSFSTQKPKI